MGTWSTAIFGNDSSCEVKEYFFEQYNLGKEPDEIRQELLCRFDMENDEESHDVLLALAYCLWQTKSLDDNLLTEIKKIITSGRDLAVWERLGGKTKMLKEREKTLSKFLSEIEKPKETAKKRVKPPVPVDSIYRNGCCLAFMYSDGQWGVVITICSEFFRSKANVFFTQTDIKQTEFPTMEDVRAAHLLDNYFSSNAEYDYERKLTLYGHYLGAKEIARLNPYNEGFFTIVGYLPEWKDAYAGSSSGKPPYSQETLKGFIEIIRQYFTYNFAEKKRTVETVKKINQMFTAREITKK